MVLWKAISKSVLTVYIMSISILYFSHEMCPGTSSWTSPLSRGAFGAPLLSLGFLFLMYKQEFYLLPPKIVVELNKILDWKAHA